MKKLIALLMAICAMGMMTACDLLSNLQGSSSDVGGSQGGVNSEEISDLESESEENTDTESESEESSDENEADEIVSSLTGGGDFNAGDNYN